MDINIEFSGSILVPTRSRCCAIEEMYLKKYLPISLVVTERHLPTCFELVYLVPPLREMNRHHFKRGCQGELEKPSTLAS